MSTKFLSPGWRMPRNANQNKQANYSLERTGVNQYVQADNISFDSGPSFTISCWVFKADIDASGLYAFYGTEHYGNSTGGFVIYYGSGSITFYSSLPGSGSYFSFATASNLLVDNVWQQVIIRYNYGVDYRIYINNVLRAVNTTNNSVTWPEQNIRLFRHYSNDSYDHDGALSDWCFFNYALSDTATSVGDTVTGQIAQLYGNGSSLPNPMALPIPPKAYYPLGGSAGAFQTPANNNDKWLIENNAIGDYVFDMDSGGGQKITSNINQSNTGGKFTVSIWANSSSQQFKFTHGSGNDQIGTFMQFYGNPIINLNSNYFQYFANQSSLNDGKWHNWVVFVDTANITNSKLWIDKTPISQGSSVTSGTANSFTTGLDLYAYTSGSNLGFLSNMMYFTDYEIDQANVDKLYNYGSPLTSTATLTQAPNAWYKLDASEVYDLSNTQWQVANNVLSDKAYSFNGTNNIEITQNSSIQTSSFSIGLWIKGYPQLNKTIIENGGTNGVSIATAHDNASVIRILTGPAPSNLGGLGITGALNGEWNFIWYTFQSGVSRGGVNGGYNNAGGGTINYDSSKGLFIGSKSDSTSGFVGEIAQVVYYNGRGDNNAIGTYGTVPTNPPISTSSTANLVSWWKLDAASITDSNGSNNGTNNGATLIDTNVGRISAVAGLSTGMTQTNLVQSNLQTVAPYSKYAMNFRGDPDDDYIQVGTSDAFSLTDMTISFWFNASSVASGTRWIWQKCQNAYTNNYGVYVEELSGTKYVILWDDIDNRNTAPFLAEINENQWYNVTLTMESLVSKMYLNGSSVPATSSATASDNLASITAPFRIGINIPSTTEFFQGSISNGSVWNAALTPTQVREIYNEGLPSNLNSHSAYSNLVSWWQLGENSSFDGTNWVCADEKGSNNGTSTNMIEANLTNGVSTTANGVSSGMPVGALVGNAPYSDANAISSGMTLAARVTGSGNTP